MKTWTVSLRGQGQNSLIRNEKYGHIEKSPWSPWWDPLLSNPLDLSCTLPPDPRTKSWVQEWTKQEEREPPLPLPHVYVGVYGPMPQVVVVALPGHTHPQHVVTRVEGEDVGYRWVHGDPYVLPVTPPETHFFIVVNCRRFPFLVRGGVDGSGTSLRVRSLIYPLSGRWLWPVRPKTLVGTEGVGCSLLLLSNDHNFTNALLVARGKLGLGPGESYKTRKGTIPLTCVDIN